MPKIKNWSRLKAGSNVEMVWKNDKTGARVDIRKRYGGYPVYTPESGANPRILTTKEQAREYAVDWMEDNPAPKSKP